MTHTGIPRMRRHGIPPTELYARGLSRTALFVSAILVCAVLGASDAPAQPAAGVLIVPFDTYTQPDLAYLKGEIPEVLKQQLGQDGATVQVLDSATAAAWAASAAGDAELARLAAQTGADFVVTGSLTWIGRDFSLDARLMAAAGDRPPRFFASVGQGVENLPNAVRGLAQEIGQILFRRERVLEVVVEGSQRIEADAVRRVIRTKPGDVLLPKNTADDIKAIYGMGYFDDIQVESRPQAEGVVLVFKVTEKPTVRSVNVSGVVAIDADDIKKSLSLKKGSVLNDFTIRNDLRRIEDMYREKNYHNVQATHTITPQSNNQADVEYKVNEGSKQRIKKIAFIGNTAFSARKLKGEIDSSEKSILSWFTSAGDLNRELLNQDAGKLTAFYQSQGYIRARVGEPQVDFESDGILVTFRINEGPRFKVGKVDFGGDLILPRDQLLKKIKIHQETFFNRETLRQDVMSLTDLYSDEGYAYVDVAPRVSQDPEALVADIVFTIDQGRQVYFEKIQIIGNTKTRDKVIRRELRVHEQELFGGQRLKRSIRNLNRLDYFENVKVDTAKGSAEDKMRATIEVTEKNTGAFSIGAGYSTVENAFVTGSVSERNLFGRGQTLALRGVLGGKTQRYTLSFTEPWLFDIPLSAGAELYSWEYEFEDYTRDSLGGKLRFGYPLYENLRGNVIYTLDFARIGDVSDDASTSIKQDEGSFTKSSITLLPRYDSRDSLFNAKEGSLHSIEYEFAGLGGNVGFNKIIGDTGWYFPLFWKLIGVTHGRAGYVKGLAGLELPDYEKFYLGGINTLRGFRRDDLAPQKGGGSVGGDYFLQGNFEIKFPLIEESGIFGIVFLDAGMVRREEDPVDFGELRYSAGPEIRWFSPIGPIRIAYGYILNQRDTDSSSGSWEFSMASAF
ncbi:MAG: outer membrane protein assembly factor BamA [Desulfobacterales bacterium]